MKNPYLFYLVELKLITFHVNFAFWCKFLQLNFNVNFVIILIQN